MKVLLTGATGFLGFRTLEKLVEEATISEIVATGRTLKSTHKVVHPKVTYILGDLADQTFVNGLVNGVDSIIHAAALSSPWGKQEAFEKANVLSQKHLIEAAQKENIQRFVYISTPSLYFELSDKLNIKEADALPEKLVNAYAKSKRQAEQLLEKANLPYVILRPRALTGRGDTVIMPRLIRAYDEGRLKIIGDGENIADLTAVTNVADAIYLSLFANGEALNQTYNITDGNPVKLWEAISTVLSKLGKTPPTKKVSYKLVKFIAGVLETKSRLTNGKEPVLTKYGVGTLAKSFTMDISKAQRLLNYKPAVTTEQAIDEFVNWYKQHEER